MTDALTAAWLHKDFAETYADSTPGVRALRDAARIVIDQDPVAALGSLVGTLDSLDEAQELLSWIEDPAIWKTPRPGCSRPVSGSPPTPAAPTPSPAGSRPLTPPHAAQPPAAGPAGPTSTGRPSSAS